MMPYDSHYRRLQNEWLAGRAAGVIPLAEEGLKLYPTQRFELIFELSQALIETGALARAAELLREADREGFWHSPVLLPDSPEFRSLRESWERQAGTVSPESTSIGTGSGPQMLALHGWGEDLALFRRYWFSPGFEAAGTIHYLQAPRRIGAIQYSWEDPAESEEACRNFWKTVGTESPDIIGGFSQGGTTAWNLFSRGIFLPRLLYLICPGETGVTEEDCRRAAESGVRIALISGENDRCLPFHRQLASELERAGAAVTLEVIPGAGHWFPENLADRLAGLSAG